MSFRKEKKFKLSSSDSVLVKSKLINSGMHELHPKRLITSQYFDTKNYKMFSESEEGVLPRKKIRVRWYNSSQDRLTFEEKTSSIEGRFKVTKKISSTDYNEILKSGISHKLYGMIFPSVLISYEREYFSYENVRITFDTNICYQHHNSKIFLRDFEKVVEIKTPFNASDDFIERIFPTPTTRFSKYCRAFLLRDRII